MEVIKKIETTIHPLVRVAAIFSTIGVFAAAGYFFYTNVWRPHITMGTVDYDAGIATINVGGKPRILYAGSTIAAGGGWGVRFASNDPYNSAADWNRIEIVKNDLSFRTLDIKPVTKTGAITQ